MNESEETQAAASRADVLSIITGLLAGSLTREDAARWAAARHLTPADDALVEDALDVLSTIDARHVTDGGDPSEYMYDFEEVADFRTVLRRDLPPSEPCCEDMRQWSTFDCSTHVDPQDCPDVLVIRYADETGLMIHDGGSSSVAIEFCPWCSAEQPSVSTSTSGDAQM